LKNNLQIIFQIMLWDKDLSIS